MKKALALPLGNLQLMKNKDIDAKKEFRKIMIRKYKR